MREYFQQRGLGPEVWAELELATAEGLTNAIEHGCAGLPATEIVCRWSWSQETIRIEIADPGHYVPPSGPVTLPEDELAERGRGRFLIAQLVDTVEHTTTSAGHTLRLSKHAGLPRRQPPQEEMEPVLDAMAEEVSRSYEVISALFKFSEALAALSSFTEFLDHSLDRLVRIVSAERAFVRFLDPAKSQLEWFAASCASKEKVITTLPAGGTSVEARVARTGKPAALESCAGLARDDPFRGSPHGIFICPVCFQSRVLGTLAVLQRQGAGYFSAGDLKLIQYVADFIGIVRMNVQLAERRESEQRAVRELEIAAAIQRSLLPEKLPPARDYRLEGISVSAQQVGGDYFDVIPLGDGNILLVIADVMGKGVAAALLATIFRTATRASLGLAHDPGWLLTAVNRQMVDDLSRVDMFITAQVAYLSTADHILRFSNAGHCPLFHFVRTRQEPAQVQGSGLPLGISDNFTYETQAVVVRPGDYLLFLTDGLYEAENSAGEMLNIEALSREAWNLWRGGTPDLCARLLDFVRDYSGGLPPSDDRTLLGVQRLA
jgi:serine phosphatase RsbU (regulator of sigma subunit)/anti-sigma regulatory factor (Ser/Thr protein kinase)